MKRLVNLMLTLLIIQACSDPYNESPDTPRIIDDGLGKPTAVDHYLNEKFLAPYNIEVKYHWDVSETDLYKNLVPARVEKIQPVMDVAHDVWIKPYLSIAGKDFISVYCPKQFVLVGSARYNFDGSRVLGTAEGGRKVVLYVVNDFQASNAVKVKAMAHVIQHEFTHILNQTISYPAAFKEISAGQYTANWTHVPLAQARQTGFITSYAMASPDEDFAEMVSMMLVEGRVAFENMMSCETTNASYTLLRKKEELVIQYFKKAFNIDFYALQEEVQKEIRAIAPDPGDGEEPKPLLEVWGYEKEYSIFNIDLMTVQQSEEMTMRFISDNRSLHDHGMALDLNFQLSFVDHDLIMLTLYYYAINTEVREYKRADFLYKVYDTVDGANIKRISSVSGNDNALELLNKGVVYLPSYFHDWFVIDWAETCSGDRYPALFPQDYPSNYCLGILSK